MRVRLKTNHDITGYAERFNTHGLGEIIVGYDEGDMSSEYITDYEVLLTGGIWVDMSEAFKEKHLIYDNYNTRFREPISDEEYQRGWFD